MARNSVGCLLVVTLSVLILVVPGCGKSSGDPAVEKATASVEDFLDSWTRGERLDKFADPNQPIHATDPDWKAGYRLMSFLSIESKHSPEMPDHVRCRVALSLKDRKGKKVEKEVVYDVQVGDKMVIARVAR
jgi:hypothetical protein